MVATLNLFSGETRVCTSDVLPARSAGMRNNANGTMATLGHTENNDALLSL